MTETVTIANGASLSGAAKLNGAKVINIIMPASWTAANLTFQGSVDNSTFNNIYDSAGNELVVVASTSRYIVDIPELAGIKYLKVRSGTSGSAVNQGASRDIIIDTL